MTLTGFGFLDIMGGVEQIKKFISDPDYIRNLDGTLRKDKKVKINKLAEAVDRQKVSISYLAGMIKNKFGASVHATDVIDTMGEEGYHPDDDYPDVLSELESIGVTVLESKSKSKEFIKEAAMLGYNRRPATNGSNSSQKISEILKLKGSIK